jgi:hypothetical protein
MDEFELQYVFFSLILKDSAIPVGQNNISVYTKPKVLYCMLIWGCFPIFKGHTESGLSEPHVPEVCAYMYIENADRGYLL